MWGTVALAVVSIGLVAAGVWVARDSAAAAGISMYVWPAVVGALAFICWWATASHLPLWVRHPAPSALAFFPTLAAVAVRACRVVYRKRAARPVAAAILAIGVGAAPTLHVADSTTAAHGETLAAQRTAIEPLAAWVEGNEVKWLTAEP